LLRVDTPVPLLKLAPMYESGAPDCAGNTAVLPWNQPVKPGPGWLLFCVNQPLRVVIELKPSVRVHTVGGAVGLAVGVGVGVGVPICDGGVAVGLGPVIVISPLFCSGENASKFLSMNSKSSGNGRQANEVELPGVLLTRFQ
jgi:hypothetical protein